VVVEHGEHGSSAAAPVAKAVYEAYFAAQEKPNDTVPKESLPEAD
jgi:cell division protein FtsI/penicillin-binding protein 2